MPNWPGSGVVVSGGSEPGAAGVAALGKVLAVASYLTDPLQPAAVGLVSELILRNKFLETCSILLKSNPHVKIFLEWNAQFKPLASFS